MYRNKDNQTTLDDYLVPFGGYLLADNRWVIKAKMIPWDNFAEVMTLIEAIECYRKRHGFYPESVYVDKIYRTRDNIKYCQARGIRLSGPKLGRPPKEPDKALKKLARQDELDRIAIEGKFGEGK